MGFATILVVQIHFTLWGIIHLDRIIIMEAIDNSFASVSLVINMGQCIEAAKIEMEEAKPSNYYNFVLVITFVMEIYSS